jgi:hypothetical protein
MKKIMFNDKFRLTDAVLNGTKTQTRRFPSPRLIEQYKSLLEEYELASKNVGVPCSVVSVEYFLLERAPYKVGEIVAVAMSYKSIYKRVGSWEYAEEYKERHENLAGWNNKMFTNTKMPFAEIKITNVRVQRLQDITDEECILEGIREVEVSNNWGNSATHTEYIITYYNAKSLVKQLRARTPRETYALLIDKISGKGTWERNPYVFVYEFELIEKGGEE